MYTYDEVDKISSVTYFNEKALPMEVNGLAKVELLHDENGNTVAMANYGADLNPVYVEEDGYAMTMRSYDEKTGKLNSAAYYGAENGEFVPIVNAEMGYHRIEFGFDDGGRCIAIIKYDAQGRVIEGDSI